MYSINLNNVFHTDKIYFTQTLQYIQLSNNNVNNEQHITNKVKKKNVGKNKSFKLILIKHSYLFNKT